MQPEHPSGNITSLSEDEPRQERAVTADTGMQRQDGAELQRYLLITTGGDSWVSVYKCC